MRTVTLQERVQVPEMQVRACRSKNRATNKKMLKQRLTGLTLTIIPLLVIWFAYVIGDRQVDMTFAIIYCWPFGVACLVSKKYILMT